MLFERGEGNDPIKGLRGGIRKAWEYPSREGSSKENRIRIGRTRVAKLLEIGRSGKRQERTKGELQGGSGGV